MPAIIQYLLGTLRHALGKIRADDRDFADAWEIGRDFARQAENYNSVRTEFQKKPEGASKFQVREALEGVANGHVGRFATMDIEKQPGYKTCSRRRALKFGNGVTVLIASRSSDWAIPTYVH